MGKNSEALQAAEEAIKGSEANKYQLWNTEEYPTVWGTEASEANPGEILFEIVNTTTESPGNESMGISNFSKRISRYVHYSQFLITIC